VDALPRRTGREARIKFGDEPAIDARNQRGLAAALLRELHSHCYAVQARTVQARNSRIVEQASTFCGCS
jgi:hypothetical protein